MKGIYVLILRLEKDRRIRVGALGPVNFRRGTYAYIGSAQNSLEKRIGRHLSEKKRMHLHIDYLLAQARIFKVFFVQKGKAFECSSARMAKGIPIKGFGCSDCRCTSHLYKIEDEGQFLRMGFSSFDMQPGLPA